MDLVTRKITPIKPIVTLVIPIIHLLTEPPWPSKHMVYMGLELPQWGPGTMDTLNPSKAERYVTFAPCLTGHGFQNPKLAPWPQRGSSPI